MKEVTLGSNEFKALSSDNRVKILKMLNERKYTLTEISKKLGLASPSSKQHLDILLKSQLVELIDEGRKWKYYSLTRKGKDLLDSEDRQTTILLLLSVTGLMFFGLLFVYTNPLILGGDLAYKTVEPAGVIAESELVQTSAEGESTGNNGDAEISGTPPEERTLESLAAKPDTTPIAIALIIVAGIMIILVLQYNRIKKIAY